MESERAYQAVVAVSSFGGGGGQSVAVEPDIVTLTTEINGDFTSFINSSTGYVGVLWWDSETPEIFGDGVPSNQITILRFNEGIPNDVTFYSCDADGIRTGTISYIDCYGNYLTGLNVTKCLGLVTLNCSTNLLTSLNVSNLTLLTSLNPFDNPLISINASGSGIPSLDCSGFGLISLNVSGCSSLIFLNCSNNLLTSISAPPVNQGVFILDNNQLSANAIDSFFSSLEVWSGPQNSVQVRGNPGTETCSPSIAEAKGWAVYTEPDIATLTTGINGSFISNIYSSTGYVGVLWWDSGTPEIFGSGDSGVEITISRENDGTPRDVTFYSCDAYGVRTGAISYIYVNEQNLTSLDVNGCLGLDSLYCASNYLTSLNLSELYLLQTLSCDFNSLTSLDLSGLTRIFYLDCSYNSLTSLDVSGFTSLNSMYCNDNLLTSLNTSGIINIGSLNCENNPLTTLDFSGLTTLSNLTYPQNSVTSLNLSGCSSLNLSFYTSNPDFTYLNPSGSAINSISFDFSEENTPPPVYLDASNCPSLTSINVNSANLTYFNVSGSSMISTINLSFGILSIGDLNFSGLESLTEITLSESSASLLPLNLSGCINLTSISGIGSIFSSINLQGCESLASINFPGILVSSLDLSDCVSLTYLDVSNGQISSINLSNCVLLNSIDVANNNLTTLDVSSCTVLDVLTCFANSISSLGSLPVSLTVLECGDNALTSLNVLPLVNLTHLICDTNGLTSLDVSTLVDLTRLNCYSNNLTSLNISPLVNLIYLYCSLNPLTTIDFTNNPSLLILDANDCQLTSVIPYASNQGAFSLWNNQLSASALNSFFTGLGTRTGPAVYIGYPGNPGTSTCNPSIARNKGWFQMYGGQFPEVTTDSYGALTSSSAVVTGTIVNDGDYPILERGIVWNTSTNPTIANNKVPAGGTAIGTFTETYSIANSGVLTYVRSYASNINGTGYGTNISFTLP